MKAFLDKWKKYRYLWSEICLFLCISPNFIFWQKLIAHFFFSSSNLKFFFLFRPNAIVLCKSVAPLGISHPFQIFPLVYLICITVYVKKYIFSSYTKCSISSLEINHFQNINLWKALSFQHNFKLLCNFFWLNISF